MAALRLVAHLEVDALNVVLLVPESQRVLPGILVGALLEHYGSPGRLAEYGRQFERVSRSPGDDTLVFAIDLETLARRAFVDVDASVGLQLVQDSLMYRRSFPSVDIWSEWGQTLLLRTLWTDAKFGRVMWKTRASGKLAANRTSSGSLPGG